MARRSMNAKIAIAAIAILAATPALAAGDCQPLAALKAQTEAQGATWVKTGDKEWEFLRGIYATNPATPPGLPYGDSAVLVRRPGNDGAMVVFIDGDEACTPMPVPKSLLDLLATVAAGRINHQGDPS